MIADSEGQMLRGFIEGIFAAVCFLYALQTRIMYPKWMLKTLDHPWILILSLLITGAIWKWSPVSAVCALLMIIAFVGDIYIFSRKPLKFGDGGGIGGVAGLLYIDSDDDNKWWEANGEIIVREDDTWITSDLTFGKPLASIPLAEPTYPTFHGLEQLPVGSAPFNPS